eukprot:5608091-Pyramimonas_sp.AAC.1
MHAPQTSPCLSGMVGLDHLTTYLSENFAFASGAKVLEAHPHEFVRLLVILRSINDVTHI